LIDKEISKLIEYSYNEAKKIISEKKDVIETIAAELLSKEVLEGDELGKHLDLIRPLSDREKEQAAKI